MSQALSLPFEFPRNYELRNAVENLAKTSVSGDRGAIYTRREVVDFILDLVGYTSESDLTRYRLLEPSFGAGDFLIPVLERLLSSARSKSGEVNLSDLEGCIRGVELHYATFDKTRKAMLSVLLENDFSVADAEHVLQTWLVRGDFLLEELGEHFTHVVGNPPYVRQESIPSDLLNEYRRLFRTIYDRSDLYVPFIEKSLLSLQPSGTLGFICSDRWIKNRYGKKLRQFIRESYSLTAFVDMYQTDAFHSRVSAYPAIFVFSNDNRARTRVYSQPEITKQSLDNLATDFLRDDLVNTDIKELTDVTCNPGPWVLHDSSRFALVRRLEASFPSIEQAGCKVGVGVATGADRDFIGCYHTMDVEASRKLPLVQTRDLSNGQVKWRGRGVINPFGEDGKLVSLHKFPRLRSYLEARKERISRRHVARRAPQNWYRTIDRIHPKLIDKEKILIPDIKGRAAISYDQGRYYPHHNLYYIIARDWDILSLIGILKTGIMDLFVSLYSTRMRGGYFRYQAQYIRRIRLPNWNNIESRKKQELSEASSHCDDERLRSLVSDIYNLSARDTELLQESTM